MRPSKFSAHKGGSQAGKNPDSNFGMAHAALEIHTCNLESSQHLLFYVRSLDLVLPRGRSGRSLSTPVCHHDRWLHGRFIRHVPTVCSPPGDHRKSLQ